MGGTYSTPAENGLSKNQVPHRPSDDKLLLNIDDIVLINETTCVIQRIQYYNAPKPCFEDVITVKFRNGQSQKYDRDQLKIHVNHIKRLKKLKQYCKKHWRFQYETNSELPAIYYSDQIRYYIPLLRLIQTAVIFIFSIDINDWCYGKIMDIKQSANDSSALDIFKVHYVKCGKIYVKYIHQFSGSIALVDSKIYTERDCSVFDEINETSSKEIDTTDMKYYRLLFQGYYREVFSTCISSNDILNLLITHIDYSDSYEMVMVIEQRTFALASKQRDNALRPKCSLVGKMEISSLPLHPIEVKLRDKLMDRGDHECTTEKFRATRKMLRLALRENEGMYSKLLKEYKIET
eukprot:231518_1